MHPLSSLTRTRTLTLSLSHSPFHTRKHVETDALFSFVQSWADFFEYGSNCSNQLRHSKTDQSATERQRPSRNTANKLFLASSKRHQKKLRFRANTRLAGSSWCWHMLTEATMNANYDDFFLPKLLRIHSWMFFLGDWQPSSCNFFFSSSSSSFLVPFSKKTSPHGFLTQKTTHFSPSCFG